MFKLFIISLLLITGCNKKDKEKINTIIESKKNDKNKTAEDNDINLSSLLSPKINTVLGDKAIKTGNIGGDFKVTTNKNKNKSFDIVDNSNSQSSHYTTLETASNIPQIPLQEPVFSQTLSKSYTQREEPINKHNDEVSNTPSRNSPPPLEVPAYSQDTYNSSLDNSEDLSLEVEGNKISDELSPAIQQSLANLSLPNDNIQRQTKVVKVEVEGKSAYELWSEDNNGSEDDFYKEVMSDEINDTVQEIKEIKFKVQYNKNKLKEKEHSLKQLTQRTDVVSDVSTRNNIELDALHASSKSLRNITHDISSNVQELEFAIPKINMQIAEMAKVHKADIDGLKDLLLKLKAREDARIGTAFYTFFGECPLGSEPLNGQDTPDSLSYLFGEQMPELGGKFIRNVASNTVVGLLQEDTTAINGLNLVIDTKQDMDYRTSSIVSGAGGMLNRFVSNREDSHIYLVGDDETRPDNISLLLCIWKEIKGDN